MTSKQNALYWRLWGQVRKVNAAADRKAMHAEVSDDFPHGLPASHTKWGKKGELDEWIKRCAAAARPADFGTQRRMAGMESARGVVFVRHLLTALGKPESYAEAIVTRQRRNVRSEYSGAGSGAMLETLETLEPAGVSAVMIALKKECRRVWPQKVELLEAIDRVYREGELDESAALEAVKAALNRESLGRGLEAMGYEELLVVLSALRLLAAPAGGGEAREAAGVEMTEDGDPF